MLSTGLMRTIELSAYFAPLPSLLVEQTRIYFSYLSIGLAAAVQVMVLPKMCHLIRNRGFIPGHYPKESPRFRSFRNQEFIPRPMQ